MLYLAVITDIIHSLLMLAWMIGLPLLFWHKYAKLSLVYCIFCVTFIIVNQISHYTLGECVFTTIANHFYSAAHHGAPNEWFTVRLTRLVFGLIPTHRSINVATQILIVISAVGGTYTLIRNFKKEK